MYMIILYFLNYYIFFLKKGKNIYYTYYNMNVYDLFIYVLYARSISNALARRLVECLFCKYFLGHKFSFICVWYLVEHLYRWS